MGKSNLTKQKLFTAYKECSLRSSHQEATVQNITEKCNVSRRAFYYHFDDCAHLVKWGFRYELDQALRSQCGRDALVFPNAKSNDPFPDFAFYARSAAGIRSLDCSVFSRRFTAI